MSRFNPAPKFKGDDGKWYQNLAAVIRNDGTGWQVINDDGHGSCGINSVTNDTEKITLNFNFSAGKCLGFSCLPSYTGIQEGLQFGPSVGVSNAMLYPVKRRTIGGYVRYSGGWEVTYRTSSDDSLTYSSFGVVSSGVLRLTHDDIGSAYGVVSGQGGVYIPHIYQLGNALTDIKFFDYGGNLITSESSNMKVHVLRFCDEKLNPTNITGKALWVMGLFEL